MVQEFRNNLLTNFPELIDGKSLLAISGGVDSVVAAYLMHQAQLNFALAHCNFQLRGEDSLKDEYFVKDLGLSLGIEVHSIRFETEKFAKNNKLSTQVAARELRYKWFEELKAKEDYNYLITAHHLDDSLETFLINFTRGTGIDGLLGIPSKQSWIRRPLGHFSRKDIETFALKNELHWREDLSNASDKYLRNKIRHQIVPKLKEINPSLAQSFSDTLSHLSHSKALSDAYLKEKEIELKKPHKHYADLSLYPCEKLDNEALLYGLFNKFGFQNVHDLMNLTKTQSGKFLENENFKLVKDREVLILQDKSIPYFSPKFDILVSNEHTGGKEAFLTKELLNQNLHVRNWKNGDYFYPESSNGKKKLSAYFRDNKISIIEKQRIQLLCTDEDIVWIIGDRRDQRYIGKNKEEQIRITLIEK